MKDQEEIKSKLAYQSKSTKEFEMYKLNSASTIAFLEENKKKLMNERDSILKRNYDILDSNISLETSVSTVKFDLTKTNLSLQYKILRKLTFDDILRVQ